MFALTLEKYPPKHTQQNTLIYIHKRIYINSACRYFTQRRNEVAHQPASQNQSYHTHINIKISIAKAHNLLNRPG